MPRPIVAIVDSTALASNLTVVRRYAPHARIWSVVKANGYGHGLNAVWQGLNQTDGFALLDLNDAVVLRENGWRGPILLLEGFFHPADLKEIDRYRLTTVVHSNWQINALRRIVPLAPLDIYVKLNSGMNRLGFIDREFPGAWHALSELKQVATLTLMTHFAHHDQTAGLAAQMAVVLRAGDGLIGPRCLANSAATLWYPETHKQWIRPGIILYGASPSGDWQDIATCGLLPVMTLTSELISIQKVFSGGHIGYGTRCRLNESQRVGVVACGYADGYPYHAPTGTPVLVDGVRTRTLGAVSMDMLMVDLKPCPLACIGSKVELWGNHIKIDEVATFASTLSYKLMSSLASRVTIQIC
ncbi:alanine racemase [Sodalis endosymbiont of Henestaris halophilus]|uniref:alanine racemase n=1 Tax=Sodalis endosymbiont of Henestaris halophilus TaxID=1929246 RepID=UPI000BC089EF|nr:alanine racemase [Sodalis endosymbiont of Henestaris halophilus]SNC58737.1 Alanine racemase, catabolic [Sodalis endosymbiont of Henestaris halophilus]